VAGVLEALGQARFGLEFAAFQLVDGIAGGALEVVMVGFAGYFVVSGCAGDINGREPLLVYELADVAVDSGDAESIDLLLGERERLVGRERSVCLQEGAADGVFLAGVAGLNSGGHCRLNPSVLRVQSQLPPQSGRSVQRDLYDLHQEQNEDDEEDQADAAAAVVADTRTHAIAAKAEHQDQDNQKDEHCCFSPFGEDSPDGGVMQIYW
jgi:hypothetical protein